VNETGKCRQFIRKAIRPCSRVAFSIRLYAQDEVEKAVNRRELIEDVWLELTHKLDKLPLEDAAPVRQALDFFLDLIVTDSSLAPPWAGFSVGSPLFVRTRRELLPRPPAYSGKLRRLRPMRTPRWLRFALNPKSDELNKIRRRTDQMLMHQEAQKEQEGAAPEREITQAK
jgi:hypothetical protein